GSGRLVECDAAVRNANVGQTARRRHRERVRRHSFRAVATRDLLHQSRDGARWDLEITQLDLAHLELAQPRSEDTEAAAELQPLAVVQQSTERSEHARARDLSY